MDPTVSIIIINHNYGRFLNAAITSALDQETPPFEVVVVDDGSTDDSREVMAGFGDRIVPVLKSAGGHVSAANAGFAAARGELCVFLDADDVLYPQCLTVVLRAWQPGDVKVQFRLDTIDAQGANQNMPFPHFAEYLTPEAVRGQAMRWGVYPWTVSSGNVFSRRLLEQLFPIDAEQIYRSPDGYINKMAPLFGDVRSLRDILGAYRVHGSNTWAQRGGGLDIAPIVRWLKFEVVLQEKFAEAARQRGIEVGVPTEIRTLQQMEYRLLAARFAPAAFRPVPVTRAGLFRRGCYLAMHAPNVSLAGRAVWLGWLAVLAAAPKGVVSGMYGVARGQTGRSAFSRVLVALSRGSSG